MTERTAKQILAACLEILQRQLPPDSDIEAKDILSDLWEVLDGPEARAIYEAEIARRPREGHKP